MQEIISNLVFPNPASAFALFFVVILVLQGVTGVGGIITYIGKFIMRNHTVSGTLVIEGQIDQEFVWDVNVSRWREVF